MAGQEGLEPSTFGFGDRRSTIGATDPSLKPFIMESSAYQRLHRDDTRHNILAFKLYFLVNSVSIQTRTKLFELQFFRICFRILSGGIVYITTFRTLKSHLDDISLCHFLALLDDFCYHASTDSPTTLADSESCPFLKRDWVDKLNGNLYIIAGHNHFYTARQSN